MKTLGVAVFGGWWLLGLAGCSLSPVEVQRPAVEFTHEGDSALPPPRCLQQVVVGSSSEVTCARRSDGSWWCWGLNEHGQLGDGTLTLRPRPIRLDMDPVQLAMFDKHACRVDRGGEVSCWGDQSWGKLGNRSTDKFPSLEAAPVAGLPLPAVQVAAGGSHTCALLTDGSVWCWGDNRAGQLGNPLHFESPVPVVVPVRAAVDDIAEVQASYAFTCVRGRQGHVWCFGKGIGGALGDGQLRNTHVPQRLRGVGVDDRVDQVALGFAHGCVRAQRGVWCWGTGGAQVGGGTEAPVEPRPRPVHGLETGVVSLSVGSGHACATKEDDSLWCWGSNSFAQLAREDLLESNVPVQVRAHDVRQVYAAGGHTCIERRSEEGLWCWGANSLGQLGTGTAAPRTSHPYGSPAAEKVGFPCGAEGELPIPSRLAPPAPGTLSIDTLSVTRVGSRHPCSLPGGIPSHCQDYDVSFQLANGTDRDVVEVEQVQLDLPTGTLFAFPAGCRFAHWTPRAGQRTPTLEASVRFADPFHGLAPTLSLRPFCAGTYFEPLAETAEEGTVTWVVGGRFADGTRFTARSAAALAGPGP